MNLKSRDLKELGYFVTSSETSRRKALNKAVKVYGLISVIRKIHSLMKINEGKQIVRTYKVDLNYLFVKYDLPQF